MTASFLGPLNILIRTYHKISRKQFLQKLGLFVLNGFNDELVVAGEVEERSARPGIRQLDQPLVAQRVLSAAQRKRVREVATKKTHQKNQGNRFRQVRSTAAISRKLILFQKTPSFSPFPQQSEL